VKITGLETFLIAVPFEHGAPKPKRTAGSWEKMESLLVRIDTDEGISGWGEAFGFAVAPVTQTALTRVLAPLCIGRDAADLPATMGALRKATQNMGRSGPVRYAMSGIDVALWDIAGKIAGKPLHALWGGAKRTAIPTYASFLPYRGVAAVERNTAAALERGYRHIKLHEHDVAPVAAARRIAGDGVALMLDTNCSWQLPEALAMTHALEPYALTWLEEPISPPDDFAALAALRRQTSIPIALGENVGNAAEAARAADAHALDVFQPDAIKIGGLSELREAVAIAERAGLRIEPHSPFFGPAIVATLHAIATLEQPALCERFYCDLEAYVAGDAVAVRDGFMHVPQRPGLGLEIDETLLKKYRV
jgi:L-alanine-DL-glutamate epimerase-like enolase superfamily enzyme